MKVGKAFLLILVLILIIGCPPPEEEEEEEEEEAPAPVLLITKVIAASSSVNGEFALGLYAQNVGYAEAKNISVVLLLYGNLEKEIAYTLSSSLPVPDTAAVGEMIFVESYGAAQLFVAYYWRITFYFSGQTATLYDSFEVL